MLRYLLKWKTYRTLKNGLLLDFFFKRFFYNISTYFFYTFTIFFADKFILEHLFGNLFNFLHLLALKIKQLNKNSFINFFKVTIFLLSYVFIIVFVLSLI